MGKKLSVVKEDNQKEHDPEERIDKAESDLLFIGLKLKGLGKLFLYRGPNGCTELTSEESNGIGEIIVDLGNEIERVRSEIERAGMAEG
jgi:hypothetical protein